MADRIYSGATEVQDPFEEITGLMRQSLITVEENCHSLRYDLKQQGRSIAESRRKLDDGDTNEEKESRGGSAATQNLYDEIKARVTNLEEICREYRIKIPANISAEIFHRAVQPSFPDGHWSEKDSQCRRSNVYSSTRSSAGAAGGLVRTENIIYAPKRSMPSEFDDTDDKFMQDVTILRTKVFSMSLEKDKSDVGRGVVAEESASDGEFIERAKREKEAAADRYVVAPSLEAQSAKADTLKFVDGRFKESDSWRRLLDRHGQRSRSKWYLVICPQIEALVEKYKIRMLHLSASKTLDFMMKIAENGSSCGISRKDVVPLVSEASEIRSLLDSRPQLRIIKLGKELAATVVQSRWRGFSVRKSLFEGKCKYIAASVIWVAWIVLMKKRRMHERYLGNMLTSRGITRQLDGKFSKEYRSIIEDRRHVVINVPSVGFPLDLRRTFDALAGGYFGIYQNSMGLKLSLIKNRKTRLIIVLAVKASDDLIEMYNETIESVLPKENAQRRVSFLELSEARSFSDRSFNVARSLHASEDTLARIRRILKEDEAAPGFLLPWIMDECDLRLAGNFRLPLLAPDLDIQRDILDKSRMSLTIDKLGLGQPPYVNDVKDYGALCLKLADKICSNTDICVWLLKLNVGFADLHTGVFLINHMSIPFMPILRRERRIHGDDWNDNCQTRSNFFKSLSDHLPTIVSTLTRLTACYESWREFNAHMIKYGCLLQAVPNEKSAKYISVSLFVPGIGTGRSPQWTGTAENLYSARESPIFILGRIIPQTAFDNAQLAPTIQRLSNYLQKNGYFGHLCIDLCCFRRKRDDKVTSLVVETNPCYQQLQHFVDWIKLAIDGSYDGTLNKFNAAADDTAGDDAPTYLPASAAIVSTLSETTSERCAIAIGHLYHSRLPRYSWNELATINKACGIRWNSSTKEGAHFLLHDGTLKKFAMLVAITASTESAIILVKNCVKKLYRALEKEAAAGDITDSNFSQVIRCIDETLQEYGALSLDKCDPLLSTRL